MLKRALFLLILAIFGQAHSQSNEENIVVVVNQSNLISTISKEQLVDLFMGKYVAFPDGSFAVPVDLEEPTSLKEGFYGSLVGLSLARVNAYWSRIRFTGRARQPQTQNSEAGIITFVESEPQAISYIYESSLTPKLKVVYRFSE